MARRLYILDPAPAREVRRIGQPSDRQRAAVHEPGSRLMTEPFDSIASADVFRASPRIERVALAGGTSCFVVDDALAEPERFVDWAVANREAFRPVDFNAYPGTYRMLPGAVESALEAFFNSHMRRCFDARRLRKMHCRLSMVTLPPAALRPYQWLPHSDRFGLDPGESIQATVLYLFRDAALGGTSFYAPTRSRDETARLFEDSSKLANEAFAERYGIAPGYIGASNAYFERIGGIAPRFNRLIFYDGSLLHSGDIPAPDRLSDDPARGRLTFNGFFVSRRHAG
jgi:hypothetical protein